METIIPRFSAIFDSTQFTDVSECLFYDGVAYTAQSGLMRGAFEPYLTTNRAMGVTILYRLDQSPVTGSASLNDAASGTWYTGTVA